MKIIVENKTKKVIFSIEEDAEINFLNEEGFAPCLEVINSNGDSFLIADIIEESIKINESVEIPDDFIGSKYLYDAEIENPWVLNPDWIAPEAPTEEVTPE